MRGGLGVSIERGRVSWSQQTLQDGDVLEEFAEERAQGRARAEGWWVNGVEMQVQCRGLRLLQHIGVHRRLHQ